MSFAERYIARNIPYPKFIAEPVAAELSMIVVVPVCNEPDLLECLNSLAACEPPQGRVELLLVINQSEMASDEVRAQNAKTIQQLADWKATNESDFLQVHLLCPGDFPKKHAGAGLARKTGMDEAIRRFAVRNKGNGVLVSLDADTTVSPNYLRQLEALFSGPSAPVGCTIRFQHRIEALSDARQRQGMALYEKYLHYYKLALAYTGYPHAIYTIGSAFAVRADAYVKQGGMPRRQAGEDFYFLHKLTAMGKVAELNSCCVYPSARLSDRVPFGTGPSLQKWMDGDESLRETYAFRAFADIKHLFLRIPDWYSSAEQTSSQGIPAPLQDFLKQDGFEQALAEIRKNSGSFTSFEKRFFQHFNAFRILKFLNFSHPHYYPFQDLEAAFGELDQARYFW